MDAARAFNTAASGFDNGNGSPSSCAWRCNMSITAQVLRLDSLPTYLICTRSPTPQIWGSTTVQARAGAGADAATGKTHLVVVVAQVLLAVLHKLPQQRVLVQSLHLHRNLHTTSPTHTQTYTQSDATAASAHSLPHTLHPTAPRLTVRSIAVDTTTPVIFFRGFIGGDGAVRRRKHPAALRRSQHCPASSGPADPVALH